MELLVPDISLSKKIGNKSRKNEILHFVSDQFIVRGEVDSISRTTFVINSDDGKRLFITSNKKQIPEEETHVVLCEKFTQADIDDNNIELVRWLKNPDIRNYSTLEIKKSWKDTFTFKKEDQVNDILGLRTPQIGAIFSILGHLTNSKEIATVVLPTGTGKTETMLSVLIANQCNKLLVTVPSDSLRSQLAGKFHTLGLLKLKDKNGKTIISPSAKYPKVGVLKTGFDTVEELTDFVNECNVIVSTMDLLTKSLPPQLQSEIASLCSHLFVDEAHHSKAGNWDKFIKMFDKGKVIQFTATPYRNDGQLLDGKTIFNFSLKEAQEQGYFKTIDFIPIREYDKVSADILIAETAIDRLKKDIEKGFDHILMARCEDKSRAEEVYKIYSQYTDFNPVMIHSSVSGKNAIKESIINKKHRIVVCVDMLGEGFDLPELKVAAFHDIRKSLPITLQFAGRFTRTSRDAKLGNASFVANLYQPKIDDELSLLYVKESNWNSILPSLSHQATQEQIDLKEFISGFQNIDESVIPYQDIKPAFSAVVYKNHTNEWSPREFYKGIKGYEDYDNKFFDINSKKQTLVVFLGSKKNVDWGNFKDVYNIEWNVFIVYWQQNTNLLFIHSSEKGSEFKDLAKAIIGDDATLVKDQDVFKSFYNLNRIKLFNVGLRRGLGKDITFQSYYGKGVQDALSEIEEKSSINNNVFGVGFEDGDVTSMGCSRKGRIWSYSRGTLNQFIDWCDKVSVKLFNPDINPEDIFLKNTIKPKKVEQRPTGLYPISADWHSNIYKETENSIILGFKHRQFDLSAININIYEPSEEGNIKFSIETEVGDIIFEHTISTIDRNGVSYYDFSIKKLSNEHATIKFGSTIYKNIEDFFLKLPPLFWFANGSFLQGYEHVEFNEEILLFERDRIINWNWDGVNLRNESEKFDNLRTDSIQYFCFQKLLAQDFDIIYNDDDSGEIADIITIKNLSESIEVEFYHLKFALEGKVSNQIKNFYEVCGQAQKSLVWKYKEGKEFIDHLIKRQFKKQQENQTRIKKGSLEDLERLRNLAKRTKPIKYDIYIVQPALSKANVSDVILNLLGVTANHLKKEGNIDLKVIGSN